MCYNKVRDAQENSEKSAASKERKEVNNYGKQKNEQENGKKKRNRDRDKESHGM